MLVGSKDTSLWYRSAPVLGYLIEGMSKEELGETMKKYEVKAPVSGNDITDPMEFNLMFKSEIGPTGQLPSFLRPETAQG